MSTLSLDNLSLLKPYLLKGDLSVEEIAFFVSKLQKGFTSNRESIADYQESEEMVSAYTAFYLPSNFKKSVKTFEQFKIHAPLSSVKNIELFDIGCGPGTMSLAYVSELRSEFKDLIIKVRLVDTSLLMLKQAKRLYEVFFPEVEVSTFSPAQLDGRSELNNNDLCVCLFANSQNEFGEQAFFNYISKISPDLICLLSPGNKDRFKSLLKLKGKLESAENYRIKYPCLSSLRKCPLPSGDWCHQVLRVKNDREFEQVSQKAKIDRRTLPYIFHLYKLSNLNEVPLEDKSLEELRRGTILQFLGKNKAYYRWRLCLVATDREDLQTFNAELPVRGFSKAEIKNIEQLQVGDIIQFKIKKLLHDDTIRIVIPVISIQT